MTAKIKLVAAPGSNAVLPYQRKYWELYFDIVDFAPENLKDDGRTALIYNYTDSDLYRDVQLPLINDHLFDSGPLDASIMTDKEFVLQGAHWMRIHSQWCLGQQCVPKQPSTPSKFFLLLMNLERYHRDWLFENTQCYLQHSIWSYVERGHIISDDVIVEHPGHKGTANDIYYVPRWYEETCFSLVAETIIDNRATPRSQNALFVSEKSFKPLAYQHPFVIHGTEYTLQYLRNLGFETFRSVFDEQYDHTIPTRRRQQAVITVVDQLFQEFLEKNTVLQTKQVKDIIEHNHDRFWDPQCVIQLFEKHVVNTITQFVESR
jgi:hypothetical protein